MFVSEADRRSLRQGDILAAVPVPLLRVDGIAFISRVSPGRLGTPVPGVVPTTHVWREDPHWLTAQLPVRLSFCAVISQCCDLEPRHEKISIPSFAVARLIPVPARIAADAQRLASLRENKDPRDRADPGYINLFYIPSHERLDNRDWVVDFNQVLSIPSSEFPAVTESKILQMEDRWRVKFKIKLAFSFTRLTDEEREAGLENPWGTTH